MKRVTILQAFEAMKVFLEGYYERTQSDDIGSLLGDLDFLEDGITADPAAWGDWMGSVRKILDTWPTLSMLNLSKPPGVDALETTEEEIREHEPEE